MPRKTRPGGRYTKTVRRDGSQTYGRRGCMVMALLALFIVAGPPVGVLAFRAGVIWR